MKKINSTVMQRNQSGGLEYLTFPAFSATGMVDHLFSTRLGGVSEGHLGAMNLSYARGDRKEKVDENYRRIAGALGRRAEEFVLTDQTHTVNVRRVGVKDAGKGLFLEKDYHDVDGFITDCKDVVLAALFADCVPLFFVDPVHRAVGLAHAGWRGSADKMAAVMIAQMQENFRTGPEDVLVGIGPCICQDCYEVSEDVMERFSRKASRPNENGKYQLDLRQANYDILLEAGVVAEHISIADLCTCCNSEYLFSHRASGGRRGNLGAFLGLKN